MLSPKGVSVVNHVKINHEMQNRIIDQEMQNRMKCAQ